MAGKDTVGLEESVGVIAEVGRFEEVGLDEGAEGVRGRLERYVGPEIGCSGLLVGVSCLLTKK